MRPTSTSPSATGKTVVCTIAAKNYLAHARALMRSVATHHPDCRLVTLVVDECDSYFDPDKEPFEVQFGSELGIPRWAHMSMKYEITELSTAVKPYFLEKLFSTSSAEKIIYFDPDILVHHPLDRILDLLDDYRVILTPHILEPLADDKSPGELEFLRVGTFNLGFIALSRQGSWQEFLHWWQEKLYAGCVRDVEAGYFVDQHWMDLAPSLFEGVHILRDSGHNIAYWNFKNRELKRQGGRYMVSGKPLVFFHFSGFVADDIERVSKYQNRFVLSQLSNEYRTCFEHYRQILEDNGHEETRKWPYSYATFADGKPVSDILRACLRGHDPEGLKWPSPWDLTGTGSFRDWATRPTNEGDTHLLSPYSIALYNKRPDLQKAFPQPWSADETAYAHWIGSQQGSSDAFDPLYIEPLVAALKANETGDQQSDKGEGKGGGNARPNALFRLKEAVRYFKTYPEMVAPHIPSLAADLAPPVYSGPAGLYPWIRQRLIELGILQRIRKLLGLRLILTARYFFSYPVMPGAVYSHRFETGTRPAIESNEAGQDRQA